MNSFSIYKAPITNVYPLKEMQIAEVAQLIRSDKLKPITQQLRSLQAKADRDKLKAGRLPYATFSAATTKRAEAFIKRHSNEFCIDIDHIGNREAIEAVKQQVCSIYDPALMFVSPSGDGLKIVFHIDTSQATHLEYFHAFENFFRKELGLTIDEACKDVARACFLCHDPECYTSETPTVISREFIDEYAEAGPDPGPPAPPPHQGSQSVPPEHEAEVIAKLATWTSKRKQFEEGGRNEFITTLCTALNRYGIDENAALTALLEYAEEGFPEKEIKATVKSIYCNKVWHGKADYTALLSPETQPQGKNTDEGTAATPPLPIEGFPSFIQELIAECTRIYGTHRDLWAAAFLAATSTAAGQSVMLKGKYENTPLQWLAVVGPSGVGKTEPFKVAMKPIHDLDHTAFTMHQAAHQEYLTALKRAKKGDEPPQEPPACRQYIVIDSTPEALAAAMNANQRGTTIIRDELIGWIMDFNRYNKSGEEQNMLSSWSQYVYKSNRKGSESLFIKEPFINVYGGIQPALLQELAKNNRLASGFLPRFCFVFPDKIKAPEYSDEELAPELIQQYETYIRNLLAIPGHRQETRLSSEAAALYADFYNHNTDLNNSGRQSDYMNEVNAKLNIIVLRAALIFHLSHWACSGIEQPEITEQTMQAAIQLTEYFRVTAKKVFEIVSDQQHSKKEIARYLNTLGNSQNEIAKALHVTQQYISKILNQ